MTVRKALLLISLTLGIVAFSAPASAQAAQTWFDDTSQSAPDIFNPKELELNGSFTFTLPFGIKIGPCSVNMKETLIYNNGTTGEGAIQQALVAAPCPTNLPGCVVEEFTKPAGLWNIELPGAFELEIQELDLVLSFSKGCAPFGLSGAATLTGTVTGTFSNETHQMEFEKAGDLKLGSLAVALDGSLGTGTNLTAT